MERVGIHSSSNLSVNQGTITPAALKSGKSMVDETSYQNRSNTQLAVSSSNNRNGTALFSPEGTQELTNAATNTKYTSRTEEVLNNFLKNLKEEGSSSHEQVCILKPHLLEHYQCNMGMKNSSLSFRIL